jgi:hypothetical protein
MHRLASLGVSFATPLPYAPNPRVLGGPFHTPWTNPPFHVVPRVARSVEKTDALHVTVRERWGGTQPPPYRPESMAAFGGSIESATFDANLFGTSTR